MNPGWKIFILILVLLIVGFVSYPFLLTFVKSLPEPVSSILHLIWIYLLVIGVGIFLIMLGVMILYIFNSPRVALWISRLGLILIIVSYLLLLTNVLLPLWAREEEMRIEKCRKLVDLRDVYTTIACLFVGYSPTEGATEVTYFNFILTSILAPFMFFFFIFKDIMDDMNFPRSSEAKNVIAFVGAYSALRGALASYFVHFFIYGWFGMGAFAFGVFMILMAWSLVGKFFKGFTYEQDVKKLLEILAGRGRPMTAVEFLSFLKNFDFSMVKEKWGAIRNYILIHFGMDLLNKVELALRNAESENRNKKTPRWREELEKIIKELGG